jgi:hypothetical protein
MQVHGPLGKVRADVVTVFFSHGFILIRLSSHNDADSVSYCLY